MGAGDRYVGCLDIRLGGEGGGRGGGGGCEVC